MFVNIEIKPENGLLCGNCPALMSVDEYAVCRAFGVELDETRRGRWIAMRCDSCKKAEAEAKNAAK